jgi:dolichol-phosphate mannosyltransferase
MDRTAMTDAIPALLPAELAVVVPTLNERENVAVLVGRLEAALAGLRWEAVFVDDDSDDGTADAVRRIAQQRPNIRVIQRVGRRGLASACIEGILATAAPYVAVMDADLQHDEALLPQMLATIKRRHVDVVVASRFAAGASAAGLKQSRLRLSDWAGRLSRLIVKAELSDPMSGFFLIERGAFTAAMRNLSGQGFKILLDLFASAPRPLSFVELPFAFRERRWGESKLDTLVAWEYLMLLLDKLVGHVVPVRFLLFATIGGLGVFTHLLVLWLATHPLALAFAVGQTAATVGAMTGNFFLNNLFTYRDRRLRGWRAVSGLLSFYAVCGIGAVANVGIAAHLFGDHHSWWLSGLAGAATGAVWNYAMSAIFTWRPDRRRSPVPAAAPAASLAESAE